MLDQQIREYAQAKAFHAQTLERWLNWNEADRGALLRLALALKASENHLRDLMDWLEDIALRDGSTIGATLVSKTLIEIETNPRLGRADKLRRIKEQIRRLRFPRLAQAEDAIQTQIRAMKLPLEIRLSVPPGLEGGRLQVEMSASNHDDFKRLTTALAAAAQLDCAGSLFEILAGNNRK